MTLRGPAMVLRRIGLAMVAVAAAAAATATVPGIAAAAVAGPLTGAASGRCIDVEARNATDGVVLQLWDCNGGANQRFIQTSGNQLQVLGKCLDAEGAGRTPGTRVILWDCGSQTNQQWRLVNGTITGVDSGLCLDATGAATANGTRLQLWTCNGGGNQSWSAGTTTPTGPTATGPTTAPTALSGTGNGTGVGAGSFANPVAAAPYGADPWLGTYNGNYYMAGTTWNSQLVIKEAGSAAALASAPEHVVFTGTGSSACCNMWAPDLQLLRGPNGLRWYLYYTAGTAACCGGQHSHVLESAGTDPMGPYTDKGQLYTRADNGFSIDGSVLQLGGADYFLYSAFGGSQNVYIAPMSNPWTVSAYGTQLTTPTYGWEKTGNPVNEAPFALQHNGRTFITFSASSCTTSGYAVGMLTYTGGPVLSPSSWTKRSTPLMQTNAGAGVYAPGGQGFFSSPDGTQTWMVYHANENAGQGCGPTRTTRIQRITWNADGTPNVAAPGALGVGTATPSGDRGGANTFPVPGTRYRLVGGNSGRVLDAVNCGTGNGTAIDQWTGLGNSCQQWIFDRSSANYFTIRNANSGTLLDSVDCGTGNGTGLDLWAALGNVCQQWSVTPVGHRYLVANRGNGLVLDVAGCSTADGAQVRQWTALGNACQEWSITP